MIKNKAIQKFKISKFYDSKCLNAPPMSSGEEPQIRLSY